MSQHTDLTSTINECGTPSSLLMAWETHRDQTLSKANFRKLLDNVIPVIRIKNFASPEECERIASVVAQVKFGAYEQLDPPILKIGPSQFESHEMGSQAKQHYFSSVMDAQLTCNEIYQAAEINPIARLMDMLSADLERVH